MIAETVLDESGDLLPLPPQGLRTLEVTAFRIVLQHYDAATVKDHAFLDFLVQVCLTFAEAWSKASEASKE